MSKLKSFILTDWNALKRAFVHKILLKSAAQGRNRTISDPNET